MGFSKQEYWSGLPFPSPVDHILSDLSTMTRPSWWPTWHGLVLLRRLWSVWSDWLVFCDYGFSVSALWCSLATPTISFVFLLPCTWVISSRLFQQSSATAPYLGWGHPSWPWKWSSSSQPSCAHAAITPWTWDCSSLIYMYQIFFIQTSVQCCNEHWGTSILSDHVFLWIYAQEWNCRLVLQVVWWLYLVC